MCGRLTFCVIRSPMKLNPQDLKKIALLTLEHYNLRAEEFWKGTRYHNVRQNIEALLQHIEGSSLFQVGELARTSPAMR